MWSVVEWVEGRGLSLRVKRDERVGVWCLDGVDVSVMAWCQTLCHCHCLLHHPNHQWSATVQCVSKPLCLLPIQSVCWCCCVVPLLPFAQSPSHCQSSSRCCLYHGLCLCVGLVSVCWVMSSDGVRGVDDAVCVSLSTPKKRQHSTRPCLHVMVCTSVSRCIVYDE